MNSIQGFQRRLFKRYKSTLSLPKNYRYPVIHLAHAGIIMRPATERNQWPRLHREKHIPEVKKTIERLILN